MIDLGKPENKTNKRPVNTNVCLQAAYMAVLD